MALPEFTMQQLLEAGVHFGHQTHRWNPKMKPFIFGERSHIHIIDLSQTVPLLHQALVRVRDTVAKGGRVLFVGTKRQAADPVAEAAARCAQYYMNHRWLGGTLTNWTTVSKSIRRLKELDELVSRTGPTGLTKKELLTRDREREKLQRALGGIQDMGGLPDLMFVVDTNKEQIAIKEAKTLGIPVIAVIDSNCDPDDIDYPFPGNDDAARAISLYCNLVADAVLDGLAESTAGLGMDLGESEDVSGIAELDAAIAAQVTEEMAAENTSKGPASPTPATPESSPAENSAGETVANEKVHEPDRTGTPVETATPLDEANVEISAGEASPVKAETEDKPEAKAKAAPKKKAATKKPAAEKKPAEDKETAADKKPAAEKKAAADKPAADAKKPAAKKKAAPKKTTKTDAE